MLHREIDDVELKLLESGEPTVLSEAEKVEGLIKRLHRVEVESEQLLEAASKVNENYARRIQELEKLQKHTDGQRKRFIDEAAEQAAKRGGPHIFNRWRNWSGTPFDMSDVCAAICEALTTHGVIAWNGDGVSIVAQMVEAGHRRAEHAEKERDKYKGGVMAVHELCDRAGVAHELEEPQENGKVMLVTELPAWRRAEMLVIYWQDQFNKLAAKKAKKPAKKVSRPRGRKAKAKR